ncbi:MAG: hypothetical protein AAF902_11620 [Chloroflexota bacterium]
MEHKDEKPAEVRGHRNAKSIRTDNNRRNLWMAVLTLVIGGSLLSGLVYGWQAILSSLPFLLIGALLIIVPWMVMQGIGRFLDWMDQDE